MRALLDSINKHFKERPEQAKLTETSAIKDLEPSDIRDVIETLYADKMLNKRLLATLLNSIFTQHRAVFLFSRRIFEDILRGDSNSKRKTINSEEFANFMINIKNSFVEQLTLSEDKEEHKANVYELFHKELLAHLREHVTTKIIKAQRDQCLGIFNSYDKTSQPSPQKTSQPSPQKTSRGMEWDGMACTGLLSSEQAMERDVLLKSGEKRLQDVNMLALAPEQIAAIRKGWSRLDPENRRALQLTYPGCFDGLKENL